MGFVGRKPTNAPLTSSDLGTGIVGSANIADGTIANADIANSTINLTTKVTGTLPVANGGTGLTARGTSLQVLRTNSGATALEFATVSGTTFGSALLHVQDEKSQSTAGGASTGTSFNTRTLNTSKTNEISGASLASNQITLPSGTYFIIAHAPSYLSSLNKLRLRNITDTTTTLEGMSQFNDPTYGGHAHNFMTGRFTIASSKVFEIQHWINDGQGTNGLGRFVGQGTEVYTTVQIWKVS
jgi:hypothetical protein